MTWGSMCRTENLGRCEMLAIHWSPVSNTKKILKNGITKSKNGVYCFPLTGHREIDAWWVKAFNQYKFRRHRKTYNGFIFRISQEYLPAYFGHWIGATSKDVFDKKIVELSDLELAFRNTLVWRIGERLSNYPMPSLDHDVVIKLSEEELKRNPRMYSDTLNDLDFMRYIFEDYQIVLENSIPPDKIIKIVSARNEFGKVLYKHKKYSSQKEWD
jgi:hypothetical protein